MQNIHNLLIIFLVLIITLSLSSCTTKKYDVGALQYRGQSIERSMQLYPVDENGLCNSDGYKIAVSENTILSPARVINEDKIAFFSISESKVCMRSWRSHAMRASHTQYSGSHPIRYQNLISDVDFSIIYIMEDGKSHSVSFNSGDFDMIGFKNIGRINDANAKNITIREPVDTNACVSKKGKILASEIYLDVAEFSGSRLRSKIPESFCIEVERDNVNISHGPYYTADLLQCSDKFPIFDVENTKKVYSCLDK